MFFSILKKDIKLALSNPLHIGIIAIFPIIIIMVFGFTMRNYMNNDFGTFDHATVFYYCDQASKEMMDRFDEISAVMTEKIGVTFEEKNDYKAACDAVEASEAYAVISIGQNGFDYFRSTFNETYGGDIVRSLFKELSENDANPDILVQNVALDIKKVNADVYYTFAGLGIALLFLGVMMSNSFGKDYGSGTLKRIMMSKAGAANIITSKFLCGLIAGVLQIAIALGLSTCIFQIDWDHNFGMILLVHIVMLIFSLCIGLMVGALIPDETTSFSIICYIAMFSNYLGGSITPVYLLEKIPFLKYVIRISPIYWTNQSLTKLYNGINDTTTRNCVLVLLALAVVCMVVCCVYTSSKSKSVSAKTEKASNNKEVTAQ